ncbi:MAG: patatin-like phospholipase family protein [Melioribacteraceae bacterium]|nr:patatin-like phospholipase family protein [Melioribacteraceae bacterium]MCF8263914.1 patatin-like phospholipase family protein [Melioribacteraceae bacterium]MCF8430319.1 patatin-like phospholipase family protein [Melioribacteraceae bacterium]
MTAKTILRKNIGLALGGGSVLGSAHIGVLKAFDEFNLKPKGISGTSIGALVATMYAFGKTWKEMEKVALELNWLDVSSMSLSKYGLLSNEKLGKLINKQLGDVNIEDANIPLAIVAADVARGEKVVFRSGSVAKAVMASSCIPGVYIPIEINNMLLVDGGIVENVPVSSLSDMNMDVTIGVDLTSEHQKKKPENIIDVLVNSFHITLKNARKQQSQKADIRIAPNLSKFNIRDTDQIQELIKAGYSEAKNVLEKQFLSEEITVN